MKQKQRYCIDSLPFPFTAVTKHGRLIQIREIPRVDSIDLSRPGPELDKLSLWDKYVNFTTWEFVQQQHLIISDCKKWTCQVLKCTLDTKVDNYFCYTVGRLQQDKSRGDAIDHIVISVHHEDLFWPYLHLGKQNRRKNFWKTHYKKWS